MRSHRPSAAAGRTTVPGCQQDEKWGRSAPQLSGTTQARRARFKTNGQRSVTPSLPASAPQQPGLDAHFVNRDTISLLLSCLPSFKAPASKNQLAACITTMILYLVLGSALAYLIWSLLCLEINMHRARSMDVPLVRVPIDPVRNVLWMIIQPHV